MASQEKPRAAFVQGNIACAEGAIAAGCRFFAGYPITPSSEIAEHLALEFPKINGRFIQMEDEIAAMGAVIGASLAGLKALTATSGPGFSLKQENIGFAAMAQVPCVIVNVMRGGPSTGLPTMPSQQDVMQAKWGTHGDHPIIALAPTTVSDIYFETIRAFNLAEAFRTPVILLLDEINAHMREKLVYPADSEIRIHNRKRPSVSPELYRPFQYDPSGIPPMAVYGEGYRFHITGLNYDETGFPTNDTAVIEEMMKRLNTKLLPYLDDIIRFEEMMTEDANLVIVAYGSIARSAKRAVLESRKKHLKVGLLVPKTMWPFPADPIRRLVKRKTRFLVPEMNFGMIADEIRKYTCAEEDVFSLPKVKGEPITPSEITRRIEEVLV